MLYNESASSNFESSFTRSRSPRVKTVSTNQFLDGLEIAKRVKDINSRTNVILGGAHVSALPEETIRYNAVDYVICGEGEYSFLNLVIDDLCIIIVFILSL